MATYAALQAEAVWGAQVVPPNMATILIIPLRTYYNLGANAIGAPGDNFHLYGRHRSAAWAMKSAFSERRTYGTVDPRDKLGNLNWYRAIDVGIKGEALYAACRRLDAMVRAGKVPGLAEWFGSYDGKTVVGWYEGKPSSSDDSHLWHLHIGLWNQFADDPETMRLLYAAITGVGYDAIMGGETEDMTPQQAQHLDYLQRTVEWELRKWLGQTLNNTTALVAAAAKEETRDAAVKVLIETLTAQINKLQTGGGSIDSAVIVNEIRAVGDRTATAVAELQAQLRASETRNERIAAAFAAAAKAEYEAFTATKP